MRRAGRWLGPAAAVLVACGALAACGSSDPSGSATLTLYDGQHVQTAQHLVTAFEKQTGIQVAIRNDDEDALANQIATEGPNSPADLFLTENTPPLESLQDKGLLAKVNPATLSRSPAKYSSPQGDWVGISGRVSVLVYNPSLIKASQLPTRISQLADPQFKGKLALAPQETDFQPIVTAYDRAYGKAATLKWLSAIKSNASGHIYPDNETIASEVNQGAVAFGVINEYYWYRMRAEVGAAKMHSLITHFAPARPRLRHRRVRGGGAQVEQAPGRGPEVPGLPGQPEGAGDHRNPRHRRQRVDQLRVPAGLGGHDQGARDAVQPAPALPDHDRPAGHRHHGHRR